jgi:hypothetical protein
MVNIIAITIGIASKYVIKDPGTLTNIVINFIAWSF